MQNRSLGVLVFPTRRSDTILCNPSLFHYGSHNKSNSSGNKKPHYWEGKSQDCSDLSDVSETNDSSLNSHLPISILTNVFEKLSRSVESSQQCWRVDTDQEEVVRMDAMKQQILLKEQKASAHHIGDASGNVPECAERNKSKPMLNERKMRTTAEQGLTEWQSSNLPERLECSAFPNTNIIATSHNSSNASNAEPNLQHLNSPHKAKSLSPSNAMQEKQKLIEGIIQRRSLAENKQHISDFYSNFFEIFHYAFERNKAE